MDKVFDHVHYSPFKNSYDEAERARKFYTELFGWKVEKAPGMEYWTITTQEGTYGGMMKCFNLDRGSPITLSLFCPGVFRQSGDAGRQDSRS